MSDDDVNHPSHYTSHPSGVECISITRHMTNNVGNAIKYLWRNGLKEGNPSVKDLEKAKFYIEDEIKRLREMEQHANQKSFKFDQYIKDSEDEENYYADEKRNCGKGYSDDCTCDVCEAQRTQKGAVVSVRT